MKKIIFLILIFIIPFLNAQNKDIMNGIVKDKEKKPIPGVSVLILQNNKMIVGTVTDMDGKYQLAIPDSLSKFSIAYSFVGMKRKEVKINRKIKKDETNK